MIPALPLFHRVAGQPVIVLGDGEAAEAKRRLVERAGGLVCGIDEERARLAFVALEDPEAAAAALKARGVLVNVPDRPDLCDFTVPSLLERAPLLIAIGTGGASAGLAKALRLRLETLLPASLGRLAAGLGEAREAMRARWGDAGERRRALDAALAEGAILDPLDTDSADRIDEWLTRDGKMTEARLCEIRLSSPDPDDLTLRQARLLGMADAVAFEPGVPTAILVRARADAARISLARDEVAISSHGMTIVLRWGGGSTGT